MPFLPSVTSKRTVRLLPRATLPSLTSPPSLMRVPAGTCFSTTSLGELKKTIESRNALSISATATANTASPLPIKTRRRCLRVIVTPILSFEPETFNKIVDALDLVGLIGQRTASICRGILGFIALAEDCIGANQANPTVGILAVDVQSIGQTLHHAANHFGTLGLRHLLGRRDIGRARSIGSRRPACHTRQGSAHKISPWRIRRRVVEQCAPFFGGIIAIAVLLVRKTNKIARLSVMGVARHRALEAKLRFVGHHPVRGGNERLAEIGFACRAVAVKRDRFLARHYRIAKTA